jgi:hypothetical protein
LQVQAGQPFEYADKLATLAQRQQELVAALDLTKGQAPGALSAELPAGETAPVGVDSVGSAVHEGDWSW